MSSAAFTLGDAQEALVLAGLALPALCLPDGTWPALCQALATMTSAAVHRPVVSLPDDLASALRRPISVTESQRIYRSKQETYFEQRLQVLASLPPRRWRPTIAIEGHEHVDAALSIGNGAILWVNEFVASDLVAKAAAQQAGLALSHLTRPEHGYSRSPLGMRVLNPIRRRAEDRFLAERVTMQGETGIAALRTLGRRLSENRVVSITVGADAVRKHSTPFLNGQLTVGTGPITLALSSGAPLLPLVTLRRGPSRFDVVIEPDIVPRDSSSRAEATDAALRALAGVLDPYVREQPELWQGWATVFTELEPLGPAS